MNDDEHNTDLELQRAELDACRTEILRLRGERLPLRVEVGSEGRMPTRVHGGDAGFDLYVSEATRVEPSQFVDVPCDIRIQLPPNMWGLITGRSSTLRTRGLLVHQGIIDSGYRGPMFCGVWNLGGQPVFIEPGERVAQFIPIPLTAALVVLEAGTLNHGDRGQQGFGSTGT